MKKALIIILLLFVLLGCTERFFKIGKEEKKEGVRIVSPNLEIKYFGGGVVRLGNNISILVELCNHEQFPIEIEKVTLSGDVFYLDGEIEKKDKITINSGSCRIISFRNLKVIRKPIGNLSLCSTICYRSRTFATTQIIVTSDESIIPKGIKIFRSNSSLLINLEGPDTIVLEKKNGYYKGEATYTLTIYGTEPDSWPVMNCNTTKSKFNVTLTLNPINVNASFYVEGCNSETCTMPWGYLEGKQIDGKIFYYKMIRTLTYKLGKMSTNPIRIKIVVESNKPVMDGVIVLNITSDYFYLKNACQKTVNYIVK